MDLFDNDSLGTKTTRLAPERIAKKSKKSIRMWPAMLTIALISIVLFCVCFLVPGIRNGIMDFVAPMYTEMSTGIKPNPQPKPVNEAKADILEAEAVVDIIVTHEHRTNVVSATEHNCICCGSPLEHLDANNDHRCDYVSCNEKLSDCEDSNSDHKCDLCGVKITDCTDVEPKDHICDTCGKTGVGEHEDPDLDHNCDIPGCDADPFPHDKIKNKHYCDHCGAQISECGVDENKDHKCDICGKGGIGEHVPFAPKDSHLCGYCGKVASNCVNNNSTQDHLCDICGAAISPCVDKKAPFHYCDVCNKKISDCVDENKDHYCDICDKKLSECADKNNDHYCDICGTMLSVCVDAEGDGNHSCDICGKDGITLCEDKNLNHSCDECQAKLSTCVDAKTLKGKKGRDLCCDFAGCQRPVYTILDALLAILIPILVLCGVAMLIAFHIITVRRKRLFNRISIEFYNDVIVYRDGKNIIVRPFVGAYFASRRFESKRGQRFNYGTVVVDCPGGPGAGMVFSRIDNPQALVEYLNAKHPKESISYSATPDTLFNGR